MQRTFCTRRGSRADYGGGGRGFTGVTLPVDEKHSPGISCCPHKDSSGPEKIPGHPGAPPRAPSVDYKKYRKQLFWGPVDPHAAPGAPNVFKDLPPCSRGHFRCPFLMPNPPQ